jgi:hypothetical protein
MPQGKLIVIGWANFYSEPEVNRLCQDTNGGQYRFLIALPAGSELKAEQGKLYVHGIRIVNGVANDAIAGSAAPLRALPTTVVPFATATVPTLAGAYPTSPPIRAFLSRPRSSRTWPRASIVPPAIRSSALRSSQTRSNAISPPTPTGTRPMRAVISTSIYERSRTSPEAGIRPRFAPWSSSTPP